MLTQNRKYLEQMQHMARQLTMSADGRGRRRQGMLPADGWLQRSMQFSAMAEQGRFFPADGGASGGNGQGTVATPSTPQSFSQPIVLQISNSTASTVSINLWGASVYLDQSSFTWAGGSVTFSGVNVSVVSTTNVLNTYYSVLQASLTNVMTVGKTLIQTISGPDAQTTQIWGLNTFAANANSAAQQFVNFQDPTQFRSNVINNFSKYDIDGQTYVTIPVLGNAVFQMAFFPLADINMSRPLIGMPAAKTYGPPPGNLAPQPVFLQN